MIDRLACPGTYHVLLPLALVDRTVRVLQHTAAVLETELEAAFVEQLRRLAGQHQLADAVELIRVSVDDLQHCRMCTYHVILELALVSHAARTRQFAAAVDAVVRELAVVDITVGEHEVTLARD